MPQAVSFSTAGLPAARRIALWEEHNAHALIGVRCSMLGESSLEATELNLQLDHMHLAHIHVMSACETVDAMFALQP